MGPTLRPDGPHPTLTKSILNRWQGKSIRFRPRKWRRMYGELPTIAETSRLSAFLFYQHIILF